MSDQSIMALRPADTPDYMAPAWISCISWAMGNPEIVAEFRHETGETFTPATSLIDREIDKATGAEWDFVKRFVEWANINIWGPMS